MIAASARDVVMEFEGGGGRTRVLHGASIEVPAGGLTLLVGPSGCGKTTLLSVLSGTLAATSGEVEVMGERLSDLDDAARVRLRRRRIGFIFQQYNLLPSLTVAENAAIPLVTAGMKLSEASRRAQPVLERLGMAAHLDKLPRQLSGGQQQRVAIARALVHEPALVVCDEPTAALDAKTGHTVMELLRAVAAAPGRAVLVVTHDSRIHEFADRIVEMEDGRVLGERILHRPEAN
ncbi:MAG: ABC transporter ATP-binding protein [Rhodocyclaceae bacterium]|jgi:putative ABC transport system ATP-binding protein|nr:ABC transporter ATP-binding protein [Rhodocyclaceae bacterium]MCA3073392.1 ABC transporter ATP-binding protein [Rhodocyclaceae bacterium]MCA3088578.1 ABC transporter ATP-binding protein [Rhodocyclaceae bacterium]MCA3092638.1 ABC transporter ATP-binding protein [Rhodocyclaceae bacterium]MCA3098575.1 ABC transporter ATP-binding protein [Rhodocyclaceae bacterium]